MNGLLQLFPLPPAEGAAAVFLEGLAASRYFFPLLFVTCLFAGVALLMERFVPHVNELTRYFVQKHAQRMGRNIETIPASALDTLTRYDWPGNIQEVQNVVQRSVILTDGSTLHVAMPEFTEKAAPASLSAVLAAVETPWSNGQVETSQSPQDHQASDVRPSWLRPPASSSSSLRTVQAACPPKEHHECTKIAEEPIFNRS